MNTAISPSVPSSYSRIIARELGMQERDLPQLLRGTGLPVSILLPGDSTPITAAQQMLILENALHIAGAADFGLRLGRRLQPATHGPMGYLVLSSPDVISALQAFAEYLPLRLPFSAVGITTDATWLTCTLELKIKATANVCRMLQECFALMLQSVVEAVLGRELCEARIGLEHPQPPYHPLYGDYFHTAVTFSESRSTFQIPAELSRITNAAGHSDSYAIAHQLCKKLLGQMPTARLSTTDQVRRMILSSPIGSLSATAVAQALFVTKRTLQRRLEQEGMPYRELIEKLYAELAIRHLQEPGMTIETVSALLGYNDSAAFRKAFQRWYGQSPSRYRQRIAESSKADSPLAHKGSE